MSEVSGFRDDLRADHVAQRVDGHLVASTALATALVPLIGYGQAAAIARHALTEGVDLRAAVAALSPLTLDAFDALSAPADGDLIACQ